LLEKTAHGLMRGQRDQDFTPAVFPQDLLGIAPISIPLPPSGVL
jgi:hypothetical protein